MTPVPGGDHAADAVTATYRFARGTGDEVRAAAEAFAVGQSVGTWVPVPGLSEEQRQRHAARVEAARPGPDGGIDVEIAFPVANVAGGGFAMLLTALLGNDPSTGIRATLVDLALPPAYAAAFPESRLGIAGWRERLGVHGRPLLLNPMKPGTGLPPEATAALAAQVAHGGVDLVKDDEVLADAPFSRVADRVRAVRRALDAAAEETGHRAGYVVSITDRPARMRDHARAAVDGGADGVMLAPFMTGFDALAEVVELLDGAVPVVAHMAGLDLFAADGSAGLAVAPEVLVGQLCRLAGADAVLIGSPWARRPTAMELWTRMAALLQEPWQELAPCFPVVGGGIVAEQMAAVVRALGVDVIVAAGGAINGHPQGAAAGARAMRRALDVAVDSARQG